MKLLLRTLSMSILFIVLNSTLLFSQTTRIMPLGDSITYDSRYGDSRPISIRTAYRSHLWYLLQNANYGADFVGSQSAGASIVPAFDTNNEGHPGWTSYEIAERVLEYITASQPDIVLLHIGTNDHTTSTRGVESILNEIDQYERATNRKVWVLVALIIDRKIHDPIISVFNKKLSQLITHRRETGDRITLVNMNQDAGLVANDYVDNTHPNDAGYKKMAEVWFSAITASYKPFNTSLNAYPSTIVNPSYIITKTLDEASNKVTFTTEIPDSGIKF